MFRCPGARQLALVRRPCVLTAVRQKGIAEWRSDADRITTKLAALQAHYEHMPRLFAALQTLNAIRVASLSLFADVRHVFRAWRDGRVRLPLPGDMSYADRADMLTVRRVSRGSILYTVHCTPSSIPFLGYALTHPMHNNKHSFARESIAARKITV